MSLLLLLLPLLLLLLLPLLFSSIIVNCSSCASSSSIRILFPPLRDRKWRRCCGDFNLFHRLGYGQPSSWRAFQRGGRGSSAFILGGWRRDVLLKRWRWCLGRRRWWEGHYLHALIDDGVRRRPHYTYYYYFWLHSSHSFTKAKVLYFCPEGIDASWISVLWDTVRLTCTTTTVGSKRD